MAPGNADGVTAPCPDPGGRCCSTSTARWPTPTRFIWRHSNKVFGPRGHVFDHARFTKELQGFSNASISERFLADEPPKRQSAIIGEKEEAFRKLVSGQIQPLPGLMKLLALADRASIPMVAVTNAPRLNAEMLLSGLGIMDRFKVVVIGDELPHGK